MMHVNEWYFLLGETPSGPHTEEHIVSLIQRRALPSTVIVWSSASNEQMPADQVFALADFSTFSSVNLWSEAPARPWRRCFARILDTCFNGMIFWILFLTTLAAVWPSFLEKFAVVLDGPSGTLLDLILTVFVAIFINAIFIGYTGTSIGKFFFGIRVVKFDGASMGYKKALHRELLVWIRGLCLGIPIVSLATMYVSFQELKRDGRARWDKDLDLRVEYKRGGIKQVLLEVLGFILTALLLGITLAA